MVLKVLALELIIIPIDYFFDHVNLINTFHYLVILVDHYQLLHYRHKACGCKSQLCQTIDYKLGITYFSAKHGGLRSKCNNWLI
jgi:hypothetical protein